MMCMFVLQRVAMYSVLQCVAVCCNVLQCDAVCCSVIQYIAVTEGALVNCDDEFCFWKQNLKNKRGKNPNQNRER